MVAPLGQGCAIGTTLDRIEAGEVQKEVGKDAELPTSSWQIWMPWKPPSRVATHTLGPQGSILGTLFKVSLLRGKSAGVSR